MHPVPVVVLALAAAHVVASTATTGVSEASNAAALAGGTKIHELKVLRPTQGRERGSLVVWARVSHARPTRSAAGRTLAGATHRGTIGVHVAGLGTRRSLRSLSLVSAGDRLETGYTVRFADRRSRARLRRLDRVAVDLSASQRLDLDGDANLETMRSDGRRRTVAPTEVEATVSPRTGLFRSPSGAILRTEGGDVVGLLDLAPGTQCGVYTEGSAPIDPHTGRFDYDGQPIGNSTGTAQLRGTFTSATVASVSGTLSHGCATLDRVPFTFIPQPP